MSFIAGVTRGRSITSSVASPSCSGAVFEQVEEGLMAQIAVAVASGRFPTNRNDHWRTS